MMEGLLHLFYPRACIACTETLLSNESYLCLTCLFKLPETRFHLNAENALAKALWGRIPFEKAICFLYFQANGIAQRLLHEIKYKNSPELALYLGELYATRANSFFCDQNYSGIIAVPLHPDKEKKRGFNQSREFAKGLSGKLAIPDLSDIVTRKVYTSTQTKLSRIDRWQNVNEVFWVQNEIKLLQQQHILIVDDVITTGATIESLSKVLLSATECKLSLASIAYTN